MAITRPEGVSMLTASLVFSVLGILFGGCKDNGMSRADGAVDGAQGGTTASTRTTAAGGSRSASSVGQGGTAGSGGISSSGASSTSTSPPKAPDAGTDTSVSKTWKTIRLSRSQAGGFCAKDDTAASVTISRGQDGSLVLGGEAFRAVPGDSTQCYISDRDRAVCLEMQAFRETTLAPAQSAELERLVAAMPPGKCTPKPNWDPCVLTKLSIDSLTDIDYGTLCLEDAGPGSHLAGERALVAYIDSLVPAERDASAASDAMISTWGTITLSRGRGQGFCPTADTAGAVAIKRGGDDSLTLSGQVFRVVPREKDTQCLDLSPYSSADCFQWPFLEIKLTTAERDQLESLVAALPPGQCTSDGSPEPCLVTRLAIAGFSTTDLGKGCREDAGPGTHLAGIRAIVAFIDGLVAAPTKADASADGTSTVAGERPTGS